MTSPKITPKITPRLSNRIFCPFLSHISPSHFMSLMTRWSKANYRYLNPLWLHNEGQNVIGFLPQTAFYLLAPLATTSRSEQLTQELQLLTLSRKPISGFFDWKKWSPSHNQPSKPSAHKSSDFSSHETDEQTQWKEQFNSPTHSLPKDLELNLTNGQNIERFIEQLIGYMDSISDGIIENDNVHKSQTHSSDNKVATYNDGLMGFIGYDVMASHLAHHGAFSESYFQQGQPAAYFGHYPLYLTCDIVNNQHHWQLHARTPETLAVLNQVQAWLQQVVHSTRPLIFTPPSLSLQPIWDTIDYKLAFEGTQSYLSAGDCYQINLTQVWHGQLAEGVSLGDYLPKLHAHTNAPYAGYLHASSPHRSRSQIAFELLSCSPELFITFDKGRKITTKPIKGTRPRGRNEAEDNRLKKELANSEKDLAENVMIVDLLRNDLGKYAKTGTVKVPKRFAIESFSNVHHIVSTITATLKENIHPLEVLFGSLPAGSITGTPKKRAVEIINELECSQGKQPRGAYCGTLGYLNFDGSGQWNVLIRSLQVNQDINQKDNQPDSQRTVSLWAGGGITIASECDAEYQECFDKVGNILQVLASE